MSRRAEQMKDLERANIAGVRRSLAKLGAVVAEVDRELRYVWIDNPHADFEASAVVGKRDDELISPDDAAERIRYYSLFAYPIRNQAGGIDSILTVGFDVPPPA